MLRMQFATNLKIGRGDVILWIQLTHRLISLNLLKSKKQNSNKTSYHIENNGR
jgi:hypothetical protein